MEILNLSYNKFKLNYLSHLIYMEAIFSPTTAQALLVEPLVCPEHIDLGVPESFSKDCKSRNLLEATASYPLEIYITVISFGREGWAKIDSGYFRVKF